MNKGSKTFPRPMVQSNYNLTLAMINHKMKGRTRLMYLGVIKIIDPTPPRVGEVTNLNAEERKASAPNREVEINGKKLISRIFTVKVPCPVAYAREPIENLNVHRMRHHTPSKQN